MHAAPQRGGTHLYWLTTVTASGCTALDVEVCVLIHKKGSSSSSSSNTSEYSDDLIREYKRLNSSLVICHSPWYFLFDVTELRTLLF